MQQGFHQRASGMEAAGQLRLVDQFGPMCLVVGTFRSASSSVDLQIQSSPGNEAIADSPFKISILLHQFKRFKWCLRFNNAKVGQQF
jgi:hypothetical protein